MALLRGEAAQVREEVFAGSTWHAAYEPSAPCARRATSTSAAGAIGARLFSQNTDDGPSKDLLLANGWADREIAKEQLYDLLFDPNEANNLLADPRYSDVLADLRIRLQLWMDETDDPLLAGHVDPPPGVEINLPDQLSASDPTTRIG